MRSSNSFRNQLAGTAFGTYLKKASSALLVPLSALFLLVEEFMYNRSRKTELLVDSFHDSAGLDSEEFAEKAIAIGELQQVSGIQIETNPNDSPICQAADIVAYFSRRLQEVRNKTLKKRDYAAEQIWSSHRTILASSLPRGCS